MQQNDDNRRSFLKQILAGTAVVAGTTLVGKRAKAQQESQAKKRAGEILYKKTESFEKYYDSLR